MDARVLLLGALGACGTAALPPPEAPRAGTPPPSIVLPTGPASPTRPLAVLSAIPPATRVAVHVAHLAQLVEALAGTGIGERSLEAPLQGLAEAARRASAEDLALVEELARAAPARATAILSALTGAGGPFEVEIDQDALRRTVDAVIVQGPAETRHWALIHRWPGAARDAPRFARAMLEEAAGSGRCPVVDAEVGRAVDALFPTRRGVPCLETYALAPADLAGRPVVELLATVEAEGYAGEVAAVVLHERIIREDGAGITAAQFGHIVELSAQGRMDAASRRMLVVQMYSSASEQPTWIEWIVDHPERVPPRERGLAALLLDHPPRPELAPRWQAARAVLHGPAVPPVPGRDFRLFDSSLPTLEAAWALADRVTDLPAMVHYWAELYRASGFEGEANKALAARHEDAIERALARCQALVAEPGETTWLARAVSGARADACMFVPDLAVLVYTPRLARAVMEGLRTAPDAWVRVLWRSVTLQHHEAEVPLPVLDAILARPRLASALLVVSPDGALWQRAPAAVKTREGKFELMVRIHAEPLLGAWPDRIEPAEPDHDPDLDDVRWYRVSSSEQPDLPPLRLLMGALRHGPGDPDLSTILRVTR